MTDTPTTPSIEFNGLRIYAVRSGDRVTGRVEFPVGSDPPPRKPVPIDYHSRRPDGSTEGGEPSKTDVRHHAKLDLVHTWQRLCRDNPAESKRSLADRAIAESRLDRVSVRSLQAWARRLDLQGPDSLRDEYIRPTRKLLTLSNDQARDAVTVCAWWAYRIANVGAIDNKMVSAAADLLAQAFPVADVLATIERYYCWDCDRTRYPFKRFSKWIQYDFEGWLHRACEQADYKRANAQLRKRQTGNRQTRLAIKGLAPDPAANPQSSTDNRQSPIADRNIAALRASRSPALRAVAHQATLSAATLDPPALALNRNPDTIAEALATLEDRYRVMLLCAAQGDRTAIEQAKATFPLWWESMPESDRNNITCLVEHHLDAELARDRVADHDPRPGKAARRDRLATARKAYAMLSRIKDTSRSGVHRLDLAGRLPV